MIPVWAIAWRCGRWSGMGSWPMWHYPIGVIGSEHRHGDGEHMTADLIELDDRGRAPLRKYGRPRGRYLVELDEDGVIHARIDASLATPAQLVELGADEL
jgi:hypothetical protein